jgi:CBS domain-containing protein
VVRFDEKVMSAFKKMCDTGASGIGVVGPEGVLIGHVSASDIKDIGKNFSIRKFFIQIDEFLMAKVAGQTVPRVVHCTPSSTLKLVFEQFRTHKTHRIHLVESETNLKPIGVVTLSDVISVLAVTYPCKPTGLTA